MKKKWTKMFYVLPILGLCTIPLIDSAQLMKNDISKNELQLSEKLNIADTNIKKILRTINTQENHLSMVDDLIFTKMIRSFNVEKNSQNELDFDTQEFVKMKSKEYFEKFINGKFTLSDLSKLANNNGFTYKEQSEKIDSFKKDTNPFIDGLNHNALILPSGLDKQSEFNKNQEKSIKDLLQEFQNAGIKSGVFAGLASAVAAGYITAAIFNFGATIPSAIAATSQALLFGIEGAVYGTFYELNKNSKNYNYVKDINVAVLDGYGAFSWIISAGHAKYNLIKSFFEIKNQLTKIINATKAIKIGIVSTSWAAPTGLGFLAIADIVLNITNLILSHPFNIAY